MREVGEPLIQRGDLIEDRRFGLTEVLEVGRKKIWYKNHNGVWHMSKDRALRLFEEGTAFEKLDYNDEPRWTLPYV